MTLAEFIDLVVTPVAGGIAGVIAVSLLMNGDPEKYERFSSWGVRLGIGFAIALALFALKVM
jgi:hypothetical protein